MWSNSATTEDLSGLAAGTYSVIVTDSLGAQDSLSVTLIQPAALTANPTSGTTNGYNIKCFGGNSGYISLTVNGGTPSYTYSWSNGDSAQNLNNVAAGSYSVIVTDANSCSVSGNITLTQPTALTASLSSPVNSFGFNVSCPSDDASATGAGKDGEIDVTVNGGVSTYTFDWSNGQTKQNLTDLSAGTYSVKIGDKNGCSLIDTITLTGPPKFGDVKDSITVYPNHESVSCDTCNDGVITAVPVDGSSPYTYSWKTGETTQGITGCSPLKEYSVKVTDHAGCVVKIDKIYFMPPKSLYWKTAGNSGTQGTLGTNDANDLSIVTNGTESMHLSVGGKIGIGTTPPSGSTQPYLLYVEGGIATREVKVIGGNFPDYVFDENYRLLSLPELKEYLKTNKHLPGIPSISEVDKKEGFDVGEMNRKLLQKVEEQTLYILQMDERMKKLEEALLIRK